MTVGELIEALKPLNPFMPVRLASSPIYIDPLYRVSIFSNPLDGSEVILESVGTNIDKSNLPINCEIHPIKIPSKGNN